MAEPMTDDRLELVLASLGENLVVPAVVVPDAPSAGVVPMRRRGRTVAVATAAALVALLAVATLSPVQDAIAAVARWLDVGSTRIERVDPDAADPTGLPSVTEGLRPASPAAVERALGRPLPSTAALGLGPPGLIATPPEGGVLLAWPDGTTLWLLPTADPVEPMLQKLVGGSTEVRTIPDLGEGGAVVTGSHVLQTPHRRVAADTVVLWTADGLQLRLESDRSAAAVLEMARAFSMAPSSG